MILWKMSLRTIKKNQRESNAQLHAGGGFAFSGESKEANEQLPDCPHQFFCRRSIVGAWRLFQNPAVSQACKSLGSWDRLMRLSLFENHMIVEHRSQNGDRTGRKT
jgi:hypothetical protein